MMARSAAAWAVGAAQVFYGQSRRWIIFLDASGKVESQELDILEAALSQSQFLGQGQVRDTRSDPFHRV